MFETVNYARHKPCAQACAVTPTPTNAAASRIRKYAGGGDGGVLRGRTAFTATKATL